MSRALGICREHLSLVDVSAGCQRKHATRSPATFSIRKIAGLYTRWGRDAQYHKSIISQESHQTLYKGNPHETTLIYVRARSPEQIQIMHRNTPARIRAFCPNKNYKSGIIRKSAVPQAQRLARLFAGMDSTREQAVKFHMVVPCKIKESPCKLLQGPLPLPTRQARCQ